MSRYTFCVHVHKCHMHNCNKVAPGDECIPLLQLGAVNKIVTVDLARDFCTSVFIYIAASIM